MQTRAVLDVGAIAQIALTRILETGDVLGRDEQGRTVIALAVEDWMFDWFAEFGTGPEEVEPDERETEEEV